MSQLVGKTMASVGDTTDIHTEARNPILTRSNDAQGNEYIYLKGVASTVAGDWVVYDELGATIRMVTTSIGPAAIAQSACVASNWGWYLVSGVGLGNALTAYADNATVNATATDGSVDDNAVAAAAELNVFGAWGRSAVNETTLKATFQIHNPYKSLALLD
jgi:hypothetical protein